MRREKIIWIELDAGPLAKIALNCVLGSYFRMAHNSPATRV